MQPKPSKSGITRLTSITMAIDLLNPLDWILWGDSQNSGKNYYDTKIEMYSYVILGGDNMQDISFRMINQL